MFEKISEKQIFFFSQSMIIFATIFLARHRTSIKIVFLNIFIIGFRLKMDYNTVQFTFRWIIFDHTLI